MNPLRSTKGLAAIVVLLGCISSLYSEEIKTLKEFTASAQVPIKHTGNFKMLHERFAPAVVAYGPYIYISGGQAADGKILDTVEKFDTRTGKSELIGHLKIARLWHRMVILEDTLIIVGGKYDRGDIKVNASVDLGTSSAANTSEYTISNPARRIYGTAQGTLDSEKTILAYNETVEAINLKTGMHTLLPPMPEPRANFACVALGKKLYVIGGSERLKNGSLAVTNTTWIFDASTDRWTEGTPMPTPREADATLVTGPFIVIAGGFDGRLTRDEVQAFNPLTNTWSSLPSLIRPQSAHTSAFLNHFLLLFGDYSNPEEILSYDLITKKSEVFTLGFEPTRHAASAVVGEQIYIFGGKNAADTTPLDLIQVYTSVH